MNANIWKRDAKKYLKKGWIILRRNSSHVQVSKYQPGGKRLNETIPMHKELKKGLECKLLKRLKENYYALSF